MKNMLWFALIALLLLSACAAPPDPQVGFPTAVAGEGATPGIPPVSEPAQPPTSSEASPTEEPAAEPIPVTGSTPPADAANAVVDVDGLNLRIGPGLNHRIIETLYAGQPLRVQGRSQDGEWIAVHLPDGKDGWVFGAYLRSEVDFAGLPVMEAYGGPDPVQPQPEVNLPGNYSLYMVIADNLALVTLDSFPAATDIVLRLGVRGEGPSMTVATGRTDDSGAASVSFEMPRYWADGSPITQTELRLTVETVDGSVKRSANVAYYQGQ